MNFCSPLRKASYQQKCKHRIIVCATCSGISSANLCGLGHK